MINILRDSLRLYNRKHLNNRVSTTSTSLSAHEDERDEFPSSDRTVTLRGSFVRRQPRVRSGCCSLRDPESRPLREVNISFPQPEWPGVVGKTKVWYPKVFSQTTFAPLLHWLIREKRFIFPYSMLIKNLIKEKRGKENMGWKMNREIFTFRVENEGEVVCKKCPVQVDWYTRFCLERSLNCRLNVWFRTRGTLRVGSPPTVPWVGGLSVQLPYGW